MGTTLNPPGERPPVTDKGHGTEALGPSDSSDTGSDVQGGPGLNEELRRGGNLNLDRGTTSDPDIDGEGAPTAGPDVGDANLESDSDTGGTGERATAGRDMPAQQDRDRGADHVERMPEIPDEVAGELPEALPAEEEKSEETRTDDGTARPGS